MRVAKSHIWQRLRLMLLLACLGFVVSIIMVPAAQSESYLYALRGSYSLQFVDTDSDISYESSQLYVHPESDKEPQVVLRKGQQVTIHTHDGDVTATTRLETVRNLLHRLRIQVDAQDTVVLDLDASAPEITITHEVSALRNAELTTTYDVERRPNPLMAKGETKIIQKGVPGTVIETYSDTYYLGKRVDSELVKRTNDTAVTEILEYGTLVDSVSRDDRIESVHDGKDGRYLTFTSGATMTYDYVTTCNATAYSTHAYTASGYPTEMGNIAVDPSVFPYGTRFFIQTTDGDWVYGMAVARDCGSSIKDHKIDLWFDEYGTACAWGRRDCTVYVLGD